MKFLFLLNLVFLVACADKSKEDAKHHLSTVQNGIQNLVDSFKLEYKASKSNSLKDSTINKYNVKLFNYLSNNSIDKIKVHVDTIIINDLTVTTKFHYNNDIAFQYGLTFTRPMTKFYDSLFRFMTELKIGSDTTINFSYMGSHQLSELGDSSSPTLKIFAIPSFLNENKQITEP